jgi:hypothetical protein
VVLESNGCMCWFSYLLAPIASMPGTKHTRSLFKKATVMVVDSNAYGIRE